MRMRIGGRFSRRRRGMRSIAREALDQLGGVRKVDFSDRERAGWRQDDPPWSAPVLSMSSISRCCVSSLAAWSAVARAPLGGSLSAQAFAVGRT
jgi:hypothetical protein